MHEIQDLNYIKNSEFLTEFNSGFKIPDCKIIIIQLNNIHPVLGAGRPELRVLNNPKLAVRN